MPPKARQNLQNSAEKEERILLAISAINNKQITQIAKAARLYNVPRSTLRDRLRGTNYRKDTRANSHKLTQNEEESLVQWILSLDQRGAPARPSDIREMANILLAERGTTAIQLVGENWVTNFIKRRDEVKSCYSRRYNYQRAKCENPSTIREWFNRVQIIIMQHGIIQEDIYNFDETGFAMGLVATARVVTRANYHGRASLIQPGNREWVTSIECINSTGWALPPCIIFKGKVHIEGWYQDSKLPYDWRIEVSSNGWTTDEITLRWLQNLFIPTTTSRTTGRYRLLILDGHGSHLTPHFDQICSENNIIPICMPAHSSHLLQPLDVGCFSPLKKAYGGLVEQKARLGTNHIDKLDFLEAFPKARESTFKAETIRNSFAGAGLVPFDPDRVLRKLNIQLKTPTPPESRSTNSAPKTPYTARQLEKQVSTVKKLLKARTQSPSSSLEQRLEKLIKGHELHLNELTLAREELRKLRASNKKQVQKRKRSARQLASAEGLTIQEGLEQFQRINEASEAHDTLSTDSALSTIEPRVRAPPRCSNCHNLGHKRLQCPNRALN